MLNNSFKTRTTLDVAGKEYEIFSLKRLEADYEISHLPYCLKILLENLLRLEDGSTITQRTGSIKH